MNITIIFIASLAGVIALMTITAIVASEFAKKAVKQEIRKCAGSVIDVTPKRRR